MCKCTGGMYTCYLGQDGYFLWSGKYPTPMYGYYLANNKNNSGFFWYLLAKLLLLYQVLKHSAHFLKK